MTKTDLNSIMMELKNNMDKNTLIKVINRAEHTVGYTIPERGVRRQFGPRQEREIEFG